MSATLLHFPTRQVTAEDRRRLIRERRQQLYADIGNANRVVRDANTELTALQIEEQLLELPR